MNLFKYLILRKNKKVIKKRFDNLNSNNKNYINDLIIYYSNRSYRVECLSEQEYLSINIYKDEKLVAKTYFSYDKDVLTANFVRYYDCLKIPINSDLDLDKVKSILDQQVQNAENFYKEKNDGFTQTNKIFDDIILKIKNSILGLDIECNVKTTSPSFRLGEMSYKDRKILFRLEFDYDGYKLTVIHNDDSEIDYNIYDEIDDFISEILACLKIKQNEPSIKS